MAVAVQGFQAYFDVLILVPNIIAYGEDRRDLCTALGGEAFSTLKRKSPVMPGFFHGKYFDVPNCCFDAAPICGVWLAPNNLPLAEQFIIHLHIKWK
jgi:hypothetical protein